jgi:hypothetical protein
MAPVNANPVRVITRVICGTGDCAQGDENIQPGASVDPAGAIGMPRHGLARMCNVQGQAKDVSSA